VYHLTNRQSSLFTGAMAPGIFFWRHALTLRNFLSITSGHENGNGSYRGGKAHGQDGVTIRRQPPMR
ncbi:hypothetical protein ACE04B_12760, partial [Rhizobium phaseoli]